MEFDFELDTGQISTVLNKLPTQTKLKVTRNAVAAGARVIRDAAKQLAPYDPKRTSGVHLRDAIVVSRIRSTNDIHKIGTRSTGNKAAPHAHLLEFGTVKASAQPFLRPAAAFSQEKAVGKMLNNLSTGILRESKKLAGKVKK